MTSLALRLLYDGLKETTYLADVAGLDYAVSPILSCLLSASEAWDSLGLDILFPPFFSSTFAYTFPYRAFINHSPDINTARASLSELS